MQGKTGKNAYFPIFDLKFFLQAEPSQAENCSAQAMARASLARAHH